MDSPTSVTLWCGLLQAGKPDSLSNRKDLWQILVVLTIRQLWEQEVSP